MQDPWPVETLVIPNLAEYYMRGIHDAMPANELAAWRQSSIAQSDMALFWGADHKLVLTPRPLDPEFVHDVCERLGWKHVLNLTPSESTDSLCSDVLADAGLSAALRARLRGAKQVEVMAWGATAALYDLLARLRAWGVNAAVPEIPPQDRYWTSVYFGSKAGFRETCLWLRAQAPEMRLAPGYTCSSRDQALGVAAHFLERGRGVAVKANFGVGGWGTYVVPTARLAAESPADILADIAHETRYPMYDTSVIVVEAFIEQPAGLAYSNPGIDILIRPDGTVQPMDVAVMLIRDGRYYEGVTYGVIDLPPAVERRIQRIAAGMGEHLASMGYRGWFDVDFMVAAGDEVFMIETNTRRLGDHHILVVRDHYRAATGVARPAVIGEDSVYLAHPAPIAYTQVRQVMRDTERALGTDDFWLMPTFVAELQEVPRRLGYVVVAPDAVRAQEVRAAFRKQLESRFG